MELFEVEYFISQIIYVLKSTLYQAMILAKALHSNYPMIYDIFSYTVAAYIIYRSVLFTARSLYTTILWMIRMILILYLGYMVLCVVSHVEMAASASASTVEDNGIDIDFDLLLCSIISTVTLETRRLLSLCRVAYRAVSLLLRHVLVPDDVQGMFASLMTEPPEFLARFFAGRLG